MSLSRSLPGRSSMAPISFRLSTSRIRRSSRGRWASAVTSSPSLAAQVSRVLIARAQLWTAGLASGALTGTVSRPGARGSAR